MKIALLLLLLSVPLYAATYTATTCNEYKNLAGSSGTFASPDPGSVMGTYATEQASAADGDIISIPARTTDSCIWDTLWTIAPTNSLTIQGAGAISATTGGASTTGTDQTIITHTTQWFDVTPPSNKSFRFTGIAIVETNGCTDCAQDGLFRINGTSTQIRVDHNHFISNPPGEHQFAVYGNVYGVMDHNVSESWGTTQILNAQNARVGTDWGNASWAAPSNWGSSSFFFLEDSQDNNIGPSGEFVTDCASGGRMVVRYNTFTGQAGVEDHEGLTDDRGCRGKEIYHNNFNNFQGWTANHVYVNGQRINDPSNHTQSTPYIPGGSGSCTSGSTTPSWNDSGGTTSDGTCTWTDQGAYNSNGAGGGRAGSAFIWYNSLVATSSVFTPTVDRLHGVNGIFSPQRPGMCGNGDLHNGWAGTVNTSGTSVTLTTGNNFYGANIQFPATSPASWPYSLSNPFIHINGVQYTVNTVSGSGYNSTSLTLTTSAGTQTGVPYYVSSLWDGNIDNTGWPCLDQAGRGQGDLLTGTFAAGTRTNSALSTPAWPRELMEPNYVWNNTDTSQQSSVLGINESVFRNNRDVFYDGMSSSLSSLVQTSPTNPFRGDLLSLTVNSWTLSSFVLTLTVSSTTGLVVGDIVNTNTLASGASGVIPDVTQNITGLTGTTITMAFPLGYGDSGGAGGTVSSLGVGRGTLANRPTTCTASVDAANGNVAAPGVAYWATDATNTQDAAHPGVLYVCNPTNTWISYYQPYTYPHPLTGTSTGATSSIANGITASGITFK